MKIITAFAFHLAFMFFPYSLARMEKIKEQTWQLW